MPWPIIGQRVESKWKNECSLRFPGPLSLIEHWDRSPSLATEGQPSHKTYNPEFILSISNAGTGEFLLDMTCDILIFYVLSRQFLFL